ncbi:hypothetical protein DSCW_26280 [Desulfosarcina widdelii]|uniref:Uncharacterized protein n=1 Tax=Desulfosarcina widdelii TaxID=947919 RepID=A0A5K7Z6C0_9BACT|nr:hypothetical protein [Desulfosarcina widdelii]BBO75211.1 hypothetical protein DSCW_26280 [Desulfosarcina widdelii]
MKCDRCEAVIPENDEREFNGQTICEDCYMTVLSPAKACDPWAAYCAKSFSEKTDSGTNLTEVQARILQILEQTGGVDQQELAKRLALPVEDFERDLAALRHMEKLRAEMRDGRKVICLW